MKRQILVALATVMFTVTLILTGGREASAVGFPLSPYPAMADYASAPPFVSDAISPNILLILDNSLSMQNQACQLTQCGVLPSGAIAASTYFKETTRYTGYFDSMTCYAYDATTNERYDPSSTKATLGVACPVTEWDGNFLNWLFFRRFDALKRAMIGADCAVARYADATCPAIITTNAGTLPGTAVNVIDPAAPLPNAPNPSTYTPTAGYKIASVGQRINITTYTAQMYPGTLTACYPEVTPPACPVGHTIVVNDYRGRVPNAVTQQAIATIGVAATVPAGRLFFIVRNDGNFAGWMCVENDPATWVAGNLCGTTTVVTVITPAVPAVTHNGCPILTPNCIATNHPAVAGFNSTVCDITIEGVCVQSHLVWNPPVAAYVTMGPQTIIDTPAVPAVTTSAIVPDADPFVERDYQFKWTTPVTPTGVIQQIGQKARFGLMVFKDNSLALDGGRVLVGLGGRQAIDFNANNVRTFKGNVPAMVAAVDNLFPKTQTPLAEGLYDALRYLAQINSAYTPAAYTYPIAFAGGNSGGLAYVNAPGGASGTGKMGTTSLTVASLDAGKEVKAIDTVRVPAETCPAGYIANACGRDPYFFGADPTSPWSGTSTTVTCCRTFILIMTDGSPALDTNVPATMQDQAHGWHGTHCQGPVANSPNAPLPSIPFPYTMPVCPSAPATPVATLLASHKTDYAGAWAQNFVPPPPPNYTFFVSAGHYVDDVAFYGHTTDLRQATIPNFGLAGDEPGHDLLGVQNVDVYTFFAFGNIDGRELLMHTALVGAFEDRNSNGVPDLQSEWDQVNNDTGAAVPDGIPDAYFESSNVEDLQDKLLATITSILSRSASGTAVSVLATSSTGEGALYQSFFFPKDYDPSHVGAGNVVKWTGYTQALFLDAFGNLREDSSGSGTPDGRLVYDQDRIIKTRYDATLGKVLADLYVDANADGQADLVDTNADGIGDSPQTPTTIDLDQIMPLWEAGKQLANLNALRRSIWTWVDANTNGVVDAGEQIEMNAGIGGGADNRTALRPYLRAVDDNESAGIVNFVRGCDAATCAEQATYRSRQLQVPPGSGNYKVWKFGDPIFSTPTIVGAPRERYDVLYGDTSYNAFFIKYRTRRQVSLVGANDGMLHAFNASFYNTGDDPSTPTAIEHGWFTTTPVDTRDVTLPPLRSPTPALGDELWGFVPREVLPFLKWLTDVNYTHITYVDLKPKVTDVRIFCDAGNPKNAPNCYTGQTGVSHPNGWGTIVIQGLRMGGSCGNCGAAAGARPMMVDLNGNATVDAGETFYSSYFVLDITEPELPPQLLWTFSDSGLGLTTSEPGVIRVKPTAGDKNDNDTAKWFMVTGSGPTGYDGSTIQTGKIFLVDLELGPKDNTGTDIFYSFSTPQTCTGAAFPVPGTSECSFMGKPLSMDLDLDNRVDVVYIGSTRCSLAVAPCNQSGTPGYTGKMFRLTMAGAPAGSNPDPCSWGIGAGCARTPTVLFQNFVSATPMGPMTTAPTATRDDAGNLWVFWGTGRYLHANDRSDATQQWFFGIKDPVPIGSCTQTTATNCQQNNLLNVSAAQVCVICSGAQVTGAGAADTFDDSSGGHTSLIGLVASLNGWYTTLPDARERDIVTPTIIGGTIFFTSFVPDADMCKAAGSSFIYALYYKTGTANKEAVIGTEDSATNSACIGTTANCVNKRRESLGTAGMGSAVALHIGAQGSGGAGGTSSGGCQGRITGFVQSSTGDLNQYCVNAGNAFSHYVSWISQRD